jgi:hypothetical protein
MENFAEESSLIPIVWCQKIICTEEIYFLSQLLAEREN